MPGKSRHGKGKHPSQSKRRRERQRYAATSAHQQEAAQAPKPAAPADIPAPPTRVPTPPMASPVAQYPYIAAELRRIGILAGIMLVILIVLAFVLS